MYKLYLQKGDCNQATQYYINIIISAVERRFGKIDLVNDVRELKKEDIVIVIAMYSLIAILRNRFNQKFIYWFQGVHAEEVTFGCRKLTWRILLRKYYMAFWEGLCLHKSKFNFFVSQKMLDHYRKKYRYTDDNYYIMPCYNQEIQKDAFYSERKYLSPSIVYAGAMLSWQCVDELFELYSKLKVKLPKASLTILTKDKNIVEEYIKKYNVSDVAIDFRKLEDLNNYMSKFKYGFLLRSDDIVNNVATPTKFNSYLAVGIIPIISNTIYAYRDIVKDMKFFITSKDEKDLDSVVEQIVELERQPISTNEIYSEYKHIFDTYYNTENHIINIGEKLEKFV